MQNMRNMSRTPRYGEGFGGGGMVNLPSARPPPPGRGGYSRPSDPRTVPQTPRPGPTPMQPLGPAPLLLPFGAGYMAPWDYWTRYAGHTNFQYVFSGNDIPQTICSHPLSQTLYGRWVFLSAPSAGSCQDFKIFRSTFEQAAADVPVVGQWVVLMHGYNALTGVLKHAYRRTATGAGRQVVAPGPLPVGDPNLAPEPGPQPMPEPTTEPFLPLPEYAPVPQWRPQGVPVPIHWPVASPLPRPGHWPIGVPIEVPIVTPGPSAPPRPRPRPNPRPDPVPTPRPSGVTVPATRIELRPDGSSRTRPDKHRKRRDGRKKMQMPAWMFAALKLYHGATEVNDFIESLADAMPKETGCSKLPGFQRAACVIANLDKVDWGQAALNVIKNEIEDQLVGRGVGKLGNASQQARGMGYHAPNTTQSTGYVRSASKMVNF